MFKPAIRLLLSVALCASLPLGCTKKSGPGGAAILRYALQNRPTSLDPHTVEDGDTIDMIQQIFEGLVAWNEKSETVPNIAEKWDISPDGTVYTFHLKAGVKFHPPSGREVTAHDFVYSFTRALSPSTKSPTAAAYMDDIVGAKDLLEGRARTLKGVEAVDTRTFKVTIDRRKPYFLGKLTYPTAFVVCREEVEKNGGRIDEKNMVGTGPFKLKEYRAGYSVSMSANTEYHRGRPLLDGIERPVLNDSNTRQTRFETNTIDYTDVARADLPRVQQDARLSPLIKQFPRAAIWYLGLNMDAYPPFRDKRVRQAFAHAINRREIVRLVMRDTAETAKAIVPPGVPGHNPSIREMEYNPKLAQELLAKAGYPGGRGLPRFTITFRQGYKHIEDTSVAIRNDLKQNLGVECDIQAVEWAQFLDMRRKKVMPCFHMRWMADYLDPQNFLTFLLKSDAPENYTGYKNSAVDKLLTEADSEADPGKRIKMYQEAEQIIIEDAAWVPIYYQRDVELVSSAVSGLRDCLMGHLPHLTTRINRR
jgi:ABC-type transport system substrate-binding protein